MSNVSRARRKLAKESKEWPAQLIEIPREDWPQTDGVLSIPLATVWRSRDFLVQVYQREPLSGVTRLSVCRTAMGRGYRWEEGISWEELQRLKRECGFGSRMAVEIFPKDVDVVNVANMRHLWVLDTPLPFAWRSA